MVDTISQIISKSKAKSVINSCIISEHFNAAETYIDLYKQKFDDFSGYIELKIELQKVRIGCE